MKTTPLLPSQRAAAITATGLAAVLASTGLRAQPAPPPPPAPAPFVGFINEALRESDPAMKAWDVGGLARVRYELHDGNGIAGNPGSIDFRAENADTHNAYVLERIQLRLGYTGSWWSFRVDGRSSLAQSDERLAYAGNPPHRGDGPESDTLDLHQAYVTLGNPEEFPLSLKVGRQELTYADERFVGPLFWNNISRVFDAAKVRWQNEWFAADFFTSRLVIPEDGLFNVNNDYEWFSGAYATSTQIPRHSLDLFFLSRNVTPDAATAEPRPQVPPPSARDIYSVGVRLKSKPGELGPWDYFVDAVGQFGNFRDTRAGAPSSRLEHAAYAVVANGGYTFKDCPTTPRIAVEYAFGSGDDDPTDDRHGTFENLYPTNHKFYGYADFVSLQNIHDLRGILQLKPLPRLTVSLEGHGFWLADTADSFYTVGGAPRGGIGTTPGTGYGINPDYGNFVGTEIDLIAGYNLTRWAHLEAGYSHFFVGDYIQSSLSNPTFGSRDANFVYLQVLMNF